MKVRSPVEFVQGWEAMTRGLAGVGAGFRIPEPPWVSQLERINRQFQQQIKAQLAVVAVTFPHFEELKRVGARCARLEQSGWLPHHTTPFDLLDDVGNDDPDAPSAALASHYVERWPQVRAAIVARFGAYRLDPESQASFGEALDAHERGLYRACSRTLFPEVERVVRTRLKAGALDTPVTSQKDVRHGMLDLDLHAVEPRGLTAMVLFNKLADHVYAHVTEAGDLARVAEDPVPNRHAVLHGLYPYASLRSSFNAIAMADFIVQVVTAMEDRSFPAAGASSAS